MTETELEILRLRVRLEVHLVLLRGIYTVLANISPAVAQSYRDQFARLRQEHAKITIPRFSAEWSDLVAGEYQEALEDALSNIETGFRP